MKEHFIDLVDGTRLEARVNFGTLYFLQQSRASQMLERIDRRKKKGGKEASDDENMELAARIIYAMLRSNGQKVTKEEAICLLPPDTESISQIINAYTDGVEDLKKKEEAKLNSKKFQNSAGRKH